MHQSSHERMRRFVDEHLAPRRGTPLRVLDVGSCDVNGSYRPLFDDPAWDYTGLDTEGGAGVDVVPARRFGWRELPARSFDVVISGQAFEHIEFPWVTILEVERVLRPGGLCCLIVPSSGPEHRYPLDCWRFYRDGLVALAHWADLDVVRADTHWLDGSWDDGGDQWHDSVLVAAKPDRPSSAPSRAKRVALRQLLIFQGNRRSSGQPCSTGETPALARRR